MSDADDEVQQRVCRACSRSFSVRLQSSSVENSPSKPIQSDQSVLCEACKKFHSRYRLRISQERCCCQPTTQNGPAAKSKTKKCRYCRYQRCEKAINEKKLCLTNLRSTQNDLNQLQVQKLDFAAIPCTVCGCSSSGLHFGVVSCEGCKGFFRRSMSKSFKTKYVCKGEDKEANGLCPPASSCRKCRLQRCVDAGMSLKDVAIGRHTIRRRAQIDAALRKHIKAGSFLKQKICRKNRIIVPKLESVDSNSKEELSVELDESVKMESCPLPNTAATSTECSDVCCSESGISSQQSCSDNNSSSLTTLTTIKPIASSSLSSDLDVDSKKPAELSSDSLISRAMEAAAHLATISQLKITITWDMTKEEIVAERIKTFDIYSKCIGDFITALPGIAPIDTPDRILLFLQGFFPVAIAQLSLNFDVERQIPNHFSLDRQGDAWNIEARNSSLHIPIEKLLTDAGNQMLACITNLQEFALFCALLVFNPETPNLSNPDSVRKARRQYEMAFLDYASVAGLGAETRIAKIYQLIVYFRSLTTFFQEMLVDCNNRYPMLQVLWTPLFKQFLTHLMNAPPLGCVVW